MLKRLNWFTLFLLLSVFSHLLNATTYYVAPNGVAGAAGTILAPLTFSAAMSKSLTAGDSVILRGGMYNFSSSQTISKSGNASKYLTIIAFAGEVPVFDFRTQAYNSNNQGVKLSGSYVHVKGIVVQGAGDNGMQVTGSYNTIDNCTFRWNCDSGLQLKTGSNNLVINCDSYYNFDYQTGGTTSPDYGGNADGFADKQYSNTGINKFKYCRSWGNSDDGWDHFQKVGNTEFDSCWCYANGPVNYDMTDHIRFKTDSATWFSKFKNTSGKYVIPNYGNGNGFKIGGDNTAHNAILRNCVSVGNKVKGFDQNNNAGSMTLYNCTGYKNSPDYGFSNSNYGSLIIKNCASLGSLKPNSLNAKTVTQSNNSWNSGFACVAADFVSLDYLQMLNDRASDGSLPEISFLHQVSTSGMIDKGIDVGLPFWGATPDLGAFEYKLFASTPESESGKVVVYFSGSQKELIVKGETVGCDVYDLHGRKLFSNSIISNELSISVAGWESGIYFVVVKPNHTSTTSHKVIIP